MQQTAITRAGRTGLGTGSRYPLHSPLAVGITALSLTLGLSGLLGPVLRGAVADGPVASIGPGAHAYVHRVAAVSFAGDVLPILQARCTKCHGDAGADGERRVEEELDLTTWEGVMAGSAWGTVIEAGNPDASVLIEMIEAGDMPSQDDGPTDAVPPEEIELIRQWIAEGAQNN